MLISIVIPCYNEEEVIGETIRQLQVFCDGLPNDDVELIFVDDGSADRTYKILKEQSLNDNRIKIVKFARNFGHQIAVTAGIDLSSGDAVVLIDADLQDPVELVQAMIEKWKKGYDVVYGTRIERQGESTFKKLSARAFYRILNRMSEVPIPLDTGDFRLMGRRVVDVLKAMPERDRFIRGMVSWVGFNQTSIPYRRHERLAGTSKYPFRKMVRFAVDGILSFSTKPLKMSIGIGILSTLLAVAGIIYAIAVRLLTNDWVGGWATILVSTLFFGGVQLLSIGIVGEYVGRIYGEIKRRPMYVIGESVGFDLKKTNGRSPV